MRDGAVDYAAVAASLAAWFAGNRRSLPWRESYEPYAVWISESMLQQTQMDRAVGYFRNWMERFPHVAALAEASEEEVLALWQGLGYYARARNLLAAARTLVCDHGGRVPEDEAVLRTLPGVGPYTAGAVASIAFNRPVPAVDANVERVLTRLLDLDGPVKSVAVRKNIVAGVRALMEHVAPRIVTEALMELGALVCGSPPRCEGCPLETFCLARQSGTERERPRLPERKAVRNVRAVAVVLHCRRQVLVRQRPPKGLWAGFWEFPWAEPAPGTEFEAAVELARKSGVPDAAPVLLGDVGQGYTVHRLTVALFRVECVTMESVASGRFVWVSLDALPQWAMASWMRRAVGLVGRRPSGESDLRQGE